MDRYSLVASIVSKIPNGVFVEIGTFTGSFASLILDNSENSTLYCVDPYISYSEYDDAMNNTVGDDLYNEVSTRLKAQYGDRVVFVRNFSKDALSQLPDEFDFVYVDGNHRYTYVTDDLTLYYPRVKTGGYIVGDDAVDLDDSQRNENGDVLVTWSPGCYGHYGVVKAFREFCTKNNILGRHEGNNYIIQK